MRAFFHDPARGLSVSAFCDRFLAIGSESHGTIVLLSVAGPHSAVKALLAAAATGTSIRTDGMPKAQFTGSREGGGRILTAPLAPGLVHGLYVGPALLERDAPRFAMLGDSPAAIFRELARRFTLPALPEWADWMAKKLADQGRVRPLAGFGAAGVEVSLTEAGLDALVAEGVRTGAVRM